MMFDLSLKASLILVAGLLIHRALSRSTSTARHLALALTFPALLALPVTSPLLPDLELAWLPAETEAAPVSPGPAGSPVRTGAEEQRAAAGRVASEPVEAAPSLPKIDARGLAIATYLALATLLLARLAFGLLRLSRITREARPIREHKLFEETRIGPGVSVLESTDVPVPMTWGLLRPVILLPVTWRQWSSHETRHALLHEHAHVERADWLMQILMQVTCALYWFHPLVWLVRRRLLLEAERACDDRVLLGGARAGDYAEQLLHLARQLQGSRLGSLDGLQMARPHQLRQRVDSVLDDSAMRRSDVTRTRKLAIGLCSLLALTLFAQVTLVPAGGPGESVPGELEPLARAAALGELGEASALLDSGSVDDGGLGEALVLAASRGDMAMVDLLLASGADPNFQGSVDYSFGKLRLMRSPLNTAAHGGHLEVVRRLLDSGAEVDMAAPHDANALMEAAGQGHRAIVELLIDRGADVNRVIRGDGTPLIMAARGGNDQIVALLLDEGAEPDVAVEGDGSPLIQAARAGNAESARLLLDAGADLNRFVDGDENPLYHAVRSGNAELVQTLIDAGADVNAEIPGDGTALIVAARSGNGEVVEELLRRGARVDVGVDGDGNALIMAARSGDYLMVRRLIEAGADVNAGVRGDGNPLIMAAAGGHLAVVELLLDNGADVDRVVPGDENALIRAAEGGHLAIVDTLLDRGADVNKRIRTNGEIRTALKMAGRGGHDDVVDLLRSRGALE